MWKRNVLRCCRNIASDGAHVTCDVIVMRPKYCQNTVEQRLRMLNATHRTGEVQNLDIQVSLTWFQTRYYIDFVHHDSSRKCQ